MGQLRQRLGEQPVKFVFLATEHPGIPDIEILDKLLDVRSALLTQDRGLHNLAIGRGFRSFVHTPESGLTDRRLVHVSAPDKHLPVASGALRAHLGRKLLRCGISIRHMTGPGQKRENLAVSIFSPDYPHCTKSLRDSLRRGGARALSTRRDRR